ncbi:class I adenylate-forming enzyme family protein [Kitasatospora sp. NPDC059577]|uniref:class I adenylate-forming enzyme family protein n=1 Tax=Kitasatospora sp. NPDC059577 TaxID=3346873 RepID=UPI0036B792CE
MTTSSPPGRRSSAVAGAPLATIADRLGGPRVDHLLSRAAAQAPDRTALRSPDGSGLSFGRLDGQVDAFATALNALTPGPDSVVAVAAELSPAFPVAYYGAARAGRTAALVNPLLREDALVHVLATSGARTAVLTPEVYLRVRTVRDRLPRLETVLLTSAAPGEDGAALLAEVVAAAAGGPVPSAPADPEAVANLLFTSGTTGAPKAVELTHRNLTVNAAQTAHAHGLDAGSVVFNYLPTYHLMHLNAAVQAVATQLLWTDPDVPGSLAAARAGGTTHYYSLPMRLSRLAADPAGGAEGGAEVPTLRAVLSGGSALPPAATRGLTARFGVPVVQGYGLAEASPQTHFDRLDDPRAGSCGPPSAGTESRIVHVDTRAELPVGERGEIQVRGPQLMKGYLGAEPAAHLDAEGWFSTGDIGHTDEDGRLFVVDRIKDVFKCDNWLVSPTEVEEVLRRRPEVADTVVVDRPDRFSGSVAYALVALAKPYADEEGAALAAVRGANTRMPYYQHLRYVEVVEGIPRSQNGKVQRREIRDAVHGRDLPEPSPDGPLEVTGSADPV